MKYPLLVYGKPQLNADGPLVFIPSGTWVIESNHSNTKLELALDDGINEIIKQSLTNGMKFFGNVIANIVCIEKGTEAEITIYARKE